jgi:hypothetical protein
MSQRAVSIAAAGAPGPLRSILTSRIGAPVTVLVVVGLMATGVVHFELLNGRPSVSIDRKRAAEVREEVVDYVQRADLPLPDAVRDRVSRQSPTGHGSFAASNQLQSPTEAPPAVGGAAGYSPAGAEPYPPQGYEWQPSYRVGTAPPAPQYRGGTRRLITNYADRPSEQR